MGNILDMYEPKLMQRMVKMIPKTQSFLTDTFFTDQQPHVTEKVQIDFVKEQKYVAPFVHPKRGGKTIENEGYQTREYNTPYLAPQTVTDADRLYARMAGENPYSGISPEERAVEYAAADFKKLENMITRRKEWMCAQALFGGKIPVKGEGIDEEIDLELTNKEVLETPWSDASSDPSADIMRWTEAVSEKSGRYANIAVCSKDVMHAYLNHPKIKERLDVRRFELGTIAPKVMKPGVIYFGTDRLAGVDLYCYTASVYDDFTDPENPQNVPLVPQGSIALIPTENDFRTFYGAVTVIPNGDTMFRTIEAQIYAHTFTKSGPDRRFLQLISRPLPVPVELDSWFVAKVMK